MQYFQVTFGTSCPTDFIFVISEQCDQMVPLLFNIWTSATMKISLIMYQICQIRNKLSKFCQRIQFFLPKWRNFAKSGHTVSELDISRKKLDLFCLNKIAISGALVPTDRSAGSRSLEIRNRNG